MNWPLGLPFKASQCRSSCAPSWSAWPRAPRVRSGPRDSSNGCAPSIQRWPPSSMTCSPRCGPGADRRGQRASEVRSGHQRGLGVDEGAHPGHREIGASGEEGRGRAPTCAGGDCSWHRKAPRSRRRDFLQERFDLLRQELLRAEWTDEVSECYGTIKATLEKKGRRIEDFDAAIAAHALARGAVLVTANVDDMVRVHGLVVEDWTAAT
jgi:predicted nucleic acid-binding protein